MDACGRKGLENVGGLQLKLTVTMSSLEAGGFAGLSASTQLMPTQEWQAFTWWTAGYCEDMRSARLGDEKRRGLMGSRTRE